MESPKILVIDDEKLLRWSLEQNLSKRAFRLSRRRRALKDSNGFLLNSRRSSCSTSTCRTFRVCRCLRASSKKARTPL